MAYPNNYSNNYYNPGFPAGTVPSISATQATPQPPYQAPAQSNAGFMTIFVNSEDEVANYPVAAGLTVLLVSFDLKKFWLKGTDTSGIPKPLRIFEFTEKTPAPQNQNGSFVSREEFSELSGKLDKLIATMGGGTNA